MPLARRALPYLISMVGAAILACHPHAGPVRAGAPKAHRSATELHHGRLPEGVVPRLYDLALNLDPNAERFSGTVAIAVELIEPRDAIVLHGENLNLKRVAVQDATGRRHKVDVTMAPESGLVRLAMTPTLPAGMATLYFDYDAPFDPTLTGMYRARVGAQNYIFTQMEPLAARRVFPCFDEPRFKTPFEVNLTVPADVFATSNSIAVGEQSALGNATSKTVVFRPTPPLPTYLIAFAVGKFDVVEAELAVSPQRPNTLPLRGIAVQGQGPRLRYTLGRVSHLVQDLEAYVDMSYPFTKLDVLAVPDFTYSAMENAATLTFRDWLVLIDGPQGNYSQRRTFEVVMAHELTHQWFGDWVTMPWWDDLWLNEAFATWRGLRTAGHSRPGMQFDLELIEGMGYAMNNDGLAHARRIREPCVTRDDIYNAGDVITYQKGAAVLNMFEHSIGPDRFRDGVRTYLRRYPYQSATSQQFLAALSRAAQAPHLAEQFNTFLDQPGVPELNVAWQCDGDSALLTLSQDRYRPLGSTAEGGTWKLPVCFRYGQRGHTHGHTDCVTMHEAQLTVPLAACPDWFIPNRDGAGYYRTRVADAHVAATLAPMHEGMMTAPELYAAQDNLAAALAAGALPADQAIAGLAQGLRHSNPRVVRQSLRLLQNIYDRHVPAHAAAEAQATLRRLVRPAQRLVQSAQSRAAHAFAAAGRHGADADAAADAQEEMALLRRDLTAFMAVVVGDAPTRLRLALLGERWLTAHAAPTPPAPLAPAHAEGDVEDEVELGLALAAEAQGATYVARLADVLTGPGDSDLRHHVVAGLGQIRDAGLAASVRALALDDRTRINERLALFAPQMGVAHLRAEAWQFVQDNLAALRPRLADKDRAQLITLGGQLCAAGAEDGLRRIFEPQLDQYAGGKRALAQACESNALCVAEREVQSASVLRYFDGH